MRDNIVLLAGWISEYCPMETLPDKVASTIYKQAPELVELFMDYDDFYRSMMEAGSYIVQEGKQIYQKDVLDSAVAKAIEEKLVHYADMRERARVEILRLESMSKEIAEK